MVHASCRASSAPVHVRDLGTIDYQAAWSLQRDLVATRAGSADAEDTLLLLQHPSVYTAGKRTEPDERPEDGTPVIDVDRGGKITWHGPGQLVGYPIVKLADPVDVVRFVRLLEQALIAVCDDLGLTSGRVEGRSGVWLPADHRPERKIAAIGIRVQRGVTMHGFEINCDADLTPFDNIVPCGIRDAGVTSLSLELDRRVTVAEVQPLAEKHVLAALDGALPVEDRWLPRWSPSSPGVSFELAQHR
ncbi:lipoyl(octanoyl) transferase LipB [Actinophytocola gossypii]|uniref:Octanoyltransferase n=1 Tax=Actinophytocola gossypii TaxID=2812003 RepID=A0ABT2J8N1_9PSEU|nr:lipoyl(octanoyl) transferase LipB [Actinophytocola gossypii]MCT2584133.1 lipoyl(octanoyl) transferase LipB [Actinophytocola gossypii]